MSDLELSFDTVHLDCSTKKLRATWNPTLAQDLYTYKIVLRKRAKRDSWRIRRLK